MKKWTVRAECLSFAVVDRSTDRLNMYLNQRKKLCKNANESAWLSAAEVSVLREYADELVTELIEFAVGTDSMRMVDAIQ